MSVQPKTQHEQFIEKALATQCQQLDNISKQNLQVIKELQGLYQLLALRP